MMGSLKQVVLGGCLVVAAGLACGKPRPVLPHKPVPPGTILLMFTQKVQGPLDLTVDGLRVPVDNKAERKCKQLFITGLASGKHHLVLLSALEAFSPDQLDVEVTPGKGDFRVLFAQQFKSVLYGKPEPMPPADAIPGVKATLEP